MKRPISRGLAAALTTLALASCGQGETPTADAAEPTRGWIMPPQVQAVESAGGSLTVSGVAAPLGRVVLRGPGGLNYAAGADAEGRFRLAAPRPARDTLFAVETQVGQLAYPAAYRLLVAADPAGPIALLALGAPTQRLDVGPVLDAVDSDGRRGLISGRAGPDAVVRVTADGETRDMTAGADGRWASDISSVPSGGVTVGQAGFAPVLGSGGDGVLTRAGAGWAITWSGPGGARQTTWFPASGAIMNR